MFDSRVGRSGDLEASGDLVTPALHAVESDAYLIAARAHTHFLYLLAATGLWQRQAEFITSLFCAHRSLSSVPKYLVAEA